MDRAEFVTTARWVAASVAGLVAIVSACVNVALLARAAGAARRGERSPSFVPALSFVFGSAALVVAPLPSYRLLAIVGALAFEVGLLATAYRIGRRQP